MRSRTRPSENTNRKRAWGDEARVGRGKPTGQEVNAQDRSSGISPQDRSWEGGVGPPDQSWGGGGGGAKVGRGKP